MTMKKFKFLVSLSAAVGLLIVQVGGAFAAPARQAFPPLTGTVQSVTVESDPSTGIVTVLVSLVSADETAREVRISPQTAEKLGLVEFSGDGKPIIKNSALGQLVEIKLTMVIPEQEADRHPVGNALETFFSDIDGLNYDTIMTIHEEGLGFGVIAQALWMTRQIGGNSGDFLNLIDAKKTGDYSKFDKYLLEDGSVPMNWGQLRKAILHTDKKNNPGLTFSDQKNNDNNKDKGKDKNKGNNEKSNNGNGNGNGNKP
jgi:hypothetical protein